MDIQSVFTQQELIIKYDIVRFTSKFIYFQY